MEIMIKSPEIMILHMAVHVFVTRAVSEKHYTSDIINLSHESLLCRLLHAFNSKNLNSSVAFDSS